MDDCVAGFLIEADRVLSHNNDRAFVIGPRALHVIVTQPGLFEHPLERVVGVAYSTSRDKRRRHIDFMFRM